MSFDDKSFLLPIKKYRLPLMDESSCEKKASLCQEGDFSDVLIIGAGIAGTSTHFAIDHGLKIVL